LGRKCSGRFPIDEDDEFNSRDTIHNGIDQVRREIHGFKVVS
jgi:hypothetical protein